MIEALVRTALAGAIARGGDLDLALALLRRGDPLLRPSARRRLRAVHAEALLATHDKHAEGGCHVLRLAFLLLAGPLDPRLEPNNIEAVARAFHEAHAHAPAARPFWGASAFALAALVAAGTTVAVVVAPRATSPLAPPAALERVAPPPHGAFATGGVPAPFPAMPPCDASS